MTVGRQSWRKAHCSAQQGAHHNHEIFDVACSICHPCCLWYCKQWMQWCFLQPYVAMGCQCLHSKMLHGQGLSIPTQLGYR